MSATVVPNSMKWEQVGSKKKTANGRPSGIPKLQQDKEKANDSKMPKIDSLRMLDY